MTAPTPGAMATCHGRTDVLEKSRAMPPADDVDAHPAGASPFGVMDMTGNIWQWTDEFQDEHTRAAIVRGGGHYRPNTSKWYFPTTPTLDKHGKYLLMAPSKDRSGPLGFDVSWIGEIVARNLGALEFNRGQQRPWRRWC